MQCYNCEKYGHFVDECLYENDGKKNEMSDKDVHIAHDDDYDSKVVLLISITYDENLMCELWYIDSSVQTTWLDIMNVYFLTKEKKN